MRVLLANVRRVGAPHESAEEHVVEHHDAVRAQQDQRSLEGIHFALEVDDDSDFDAVPPSPVDSAFAGAASPDESDFDAAPSEPDFRCAFLP